MDLAERVAVLESRADYFQAALLEETKKRENGTKYTHNLLEDVQHRLNEMGIEMRRGFEQDNATDQQMEDRLSTVVKEQESRLRVLERLAWTAIGGLAFFGAITSFFGTRILALLTP